PAFLHGPDDFPFDRGFDNAIIRGKKPHLCAGHIIEKAITSSSMTNGVTMTTGYCRKRHPSRGSFALPARRERRQALHTPHKAISIPLYNGGSCRPVRRMIASRPYLGCSSVGVRQEISQTGVV